MAKIGFEVKNTDGTYNNSLAKANIKFKDVNTLAEISYTTLTLLDSYGHYVADGFSEWHIVNIYINDVLQSSFGDIEIETTSPTFTNPIVSGLLTLSGGILQDSLVCSGQAIFLSSVAFDKSGGVGNDLGRIRNAELKTITPYGQGGNEGVTIDGIYLKDDLATSNIGGLSSSNTWTGLNTFSSTANFQSGLSADGLGVFTKGLYVYGGGLTSAFYHPVRFYMYRPQCSLAPVNPIDLSNKNYVDSQITTAIGSFSTSGYQESRNIVRLIPNGVEQTGKVYTTYADAIAYCSASASLTSQYTILICGNGISTTNIIPTVLVDYVHLKGLGSNIKLNIAGLSLTASALGNIILQNLILTEEEGSEGNNLTNLVLDRTDCKDINTITTLTNCRLLGLPSFTTDTNDTYQFVNSEGNIMTDNHTVVVTGTSKVNILSPDKFTINTITLQDDGTQFYVNSGLKIDNGCVIGGQTDIKDRLCVTGSIFSTNSTEVSLSATSFNLTAATISLSQVPVDNKIRLTLGDGNVYTVDVTPA